MSFDCRYSDSASCLHLLHVPGIILLRVKIKIHCSCEIEYFVEAHLCKLCVILRSRVLRMCVLIKDIGRRLPLQIQCSYQDQIRMMLGSLCAETIKPVSEPWGKI